MKINKHFSVFCVLAVMFALVFAACFDGRQGNEASIILNLGGGAGNREVWWPHYDNPGILDEILYKGEIIGPDYIEIVPTNETIIKMTVTPGIYTITIEAWYRNELYAIGSVENFPIKAGSNNVPIKLKPWNETSEEEEDTPEIEGIEVTSWNELKTNIEGSNGEVTFIIKNNLTANTTVEYININDGQEITLIADTDVTINVAAIDYDTPFNVYGNGVLTLGKNGMKGKLIIDGGYNGFRKSSGIVKIYNGGEMIMNSGVTLTRSYSDYGAVKVEAGGSFIMNDGTISGNFGESGGGVRIEGGSFIMYRGTIVDNETRQHVDGYYSGGGVFVSDGYIPCEDGPIISPGFFIMKYGIITQNNSDKGGGVYVGAGGTFYMCDGEISGNIANLIGGGVYIAEGGIFHKKQGTIYGDNDEVEDHLRNTDSDHCSIFLGNSLVSYNLTIGPDEPLDDEPLDDEP